MKKVLLTFSLISIAFSNYTYGQEKVGIYTDAPKATLDVNGNVKIRKVPTADASEERTQLYWDKEDKIVRTVGEAKPFYAIEYRLKSANNKKATIDDFNTNIPTSQYQVILTDIYPAVDEQSQNNVGIEHASISGEYYSESYDYTKYATNILQGGNDQTNRKINPVRHTSCFAKDGTWHISAGYIKSDPYNGNVFTWHIRLLAVNLAFGESRTLSPRGEDTLQVIGNPPTGETQQNPLDSDDYIVK